MVPEMRVPQLIIAISLLLFGCETKTQTGALTGAGIGVGAGALIGGWQGALIGGAVGAVGGALIGAALDDADRKSLEAQNPRTLRKIDHGQKLDVQDIKDMSKAGIRDDVIISQIQATGSRFHLTTADIVDLKNSGVSQRVINAMIRSGK
jgi:outer membrane lipoprotein SlyB